MNTKLTRALAAALSAVAMFAFAQDAETVKVRGKGVGADKTEALKDAYRDAVERAVGLYVDAEQMMKNEELVKDQILTQSNAYIEKYDVAKETTNPNGLVEIQILAEVRKTALTKKISDVMPTKTFRLSDGLKNEHARMTTVEKRNVDGAALLNKALEDFNPLEASIDCSLASGKAVVGRLSQGRSSAGKSSVEVNYLFKIEMNEQRFFESTAKLTEVLDAISVSDPVSVSIPAERVRSLSTGDENVDIDKWIANTEKFVIGSPAVPRRQSESINVKMPFGRDNCSILIVTGANKFKSIYQGRVYTLDDDTMNVFRDWRNRLTRKGKFLTFRVTFLDSAGSEITIGELPSGVSNMQQLIGEGKIAPWLRSRTSSGRPLALAEYFWGTFTIPKDALPEVSDMKIEIVK